MNRKFFFTTLLALVAIGVMIRLGFWQLDRLTQRRAFNAEVSRRLQAPPLTFADLTSLGDPLGLEYHAVALRGEYDFTQQVALSNQDWQGQPGVRLITPLVIADSNRAVLVDRGWIPYEESAPANWNKFAELGMVEVRGWILPTQTSLFPTAPVTRHQDSWFRVDIAALQAQISHPLLPVYIQQSPDPARKQLPYRSELNVDLSEGPHMGYAMTWFAFAAILSVGYAGYVLGGHGQPISQRQLAPGVSKNRETKGVGW